MKVIKKDRLAIWASSMLAKAQAKIHVSPEALVKLNVDIVDSNGEVLTRTLGKSHSVTANYHAICSVTGILHPLVENYGGGSGYAGAWQVSTTANVYYYSVPFSNVGTAGIGAAGDATLGIQIGTNSAYGEHFYADWTLQALVAHGIGAGQAYYNAQSKKVTWDSGTRVWTCNITRGFTNRSGSTISISEIGLVENVYIAAAGTIVKVLMLRDQLNPSPIVLLNSRSAVITYEFVYQFP